MKSIWSYSSYHHEAPQKTQHQSCSNILIITKALFYVDRYTKSLHTLQDTQ